MEQDLIQMALYCGVNLQMNSLTCRYKKPWHRCWSLISLCASSFSLNTFSPLRGHLCPSVGPLLTTSQDGFWLHWGELLNTFVDRHCWRPDDSYTNNAPIHPSGSSEAAQLFHTLEKRCLSRECFASHSHKYIHKSFLLWDQFFICVLLKVSVSPMEVFLIALVCDCVRG